MTGEDPDPEVLRERRERAGKINAELARLFPDAAIALRYDNPWQLLVAVILSAQCTDRKVKEVTSELFAKYRTFDDYVRADPGEFEQDILKTARIIQERHECTGHPLTKIYPPAAETWP